MNIDIQDNQQIYTFEILEDGFRNIIGNLHSGYHRYYFLVIPRTKSININISYKIRSDKVNILLPKYDFENKVFQKVEYEFKIGVNKNIYPGWTVYFNYMYFENDVRGFKRNVEILKKENSLLSKEKLTHEEMLKRMDSENQKKIFNLNNTIAECKQKITELEKVIENQKDIILEQSRNILLNSTIKSIQKNIQKIEFIDLYINMDDLSQFIMSIVKNEAVDNAQIKSFNKNINKCIINKYSLDELLDRSGFIFEINGLIYKLQTKKLILNDCEVEIIGNKYRIIQDLQIDKKFEDYPLNSFNLGNFELDYMLLHDKNFKIQHNLLVYKQDSKNYIYQLKIKLI